MGRYNEFLLLKVNILNIQSIVLSWYLYCQSTNKFYEPFLMEYTIKFVTKVNNTDQTF